MSTQIHTEVEIRGSIDFVSLGPWEFNYSGVYTVFFGSGITLAASTLVQVIGGVAPILSSIVTLQYLLIVPQSAIKIGLHGVNAQTDGFILAANAPLCINGGTLTAMNMYNHGTATATIFLAAGGLAT